MNARTGRDSSDSNGNYSILTHKDLGTEETEEKNIQFRFNLFGKLQIYYGEQPIHGIEARKVQELLCYLLIFRDQPHSREVLAGYMWGDYPSTVSKKYLRQALWVLQSTFSRYIGRDSEAILLVEPDWIQVNPNSTLWLDVMEFERVNTMLQSLRMEEIDAQHFNTIRDTIKLYQGELLAGWYQDWCIFHREKYLSYYINMMNLLVSYCLLKQRYNEGISFGSDLLLCDRASERTYRQLMRLYYLSGDRTKAIRLFHQCGETLKHELGVTPSGQTHALYESICLEKPIYTPSVQKEQELSGSQESILVSVMRRLDEFNNALRELQQQIQSEIQIIEGLFKRGT